MKKVLILDQRNELSGRLRFHSDKMGEFRKVPNLSITAFLPHKYTSIKEKLTKEANSIFIHVIDFDPSCPEASILIDFFKKFPTCLDKVTLVTCCENHEDLTKIFLKNNGISSIKFLDTLDFKEAIKDINASDNSSATIKITT